MAPVQPIAQDPSSASNHVYASGILFATFSFITMLLILPPMFWHFRNRNIGATALIAWLVILLFFNFINVILWPTDDWHTWYNGVGLCDIEVKIQVAASVALPASFACILRALAAVMDVERTRLVQTKAERRRAYAIDLSWCLGFPLLEMLFHYIVQPFRYYIWSISGCGAVVDSSWLAIFLIIVPPAIWFVVNAYYASGSSLDHHTHGQYRQLTHQTSTHHRPPLPLPHQLPHHPRQPQHDQVSFPAPLHRLPPLVVLLNPRRSLHHRRQRTATSQLLQLERDAQRRDVEKDRLHSQSRPHLVRPLASAGLWNPGLHLLRLWKGCCQHVQVVLDGHGAGEVHCADGGGRRKSCSCGCQFVRRHDEVVCGLEAEAFGFWREQGFQVHNELHY